MSLAVGVVIEMAGAVESEEDAQPSPRAVSLVSLLLQIPSLLLKQFNNILDVYGSRVIGPDTTLLSTSQYCWPARSITLAAFYVL